MCVLVGVLLTVTVYSFFIFEKCDSTALSKSFQIAFGQKLRYYRQN